MNKTEPIEELAYRTGSSRAEAQWRVEAFASVGAARGAQAGGPPLPPGYTLDASDSDLLLLLREVGTMAAAFSARSAIARGMMEAAEQDVHPAVNGWQP